MKFLVYSDLHLHLWSYNSSVEDGHNTRLRLQQKVLDQIKSYAITNGIRDIFCAGDVFHTQGKIDSEVLEAAYSSFKSIKEAGLNQFWIPGNHDQKDKEGRIHSLNFLKEVGYVFDKPSVINYNGQYIGFMPYTESKDDLVKFFKFVSDRAGSICFIHQGVSGVPLKTGILLDEIFHPSMVPPKVRHVFAGHYHTHKLISPKITIPGSPMQHTWGDVGEARGWLDCTFDEEISIKLIESKHPKFIRGSSEEALPGDWIEEMGDTQPEEPRIQITQADFSDLELVAEEYADKRNLDSYTRKLGKNLRDGKHELSLD